MDFTEVRLREVEQAGEDARRRWIANKAQEMRLSPTEGELAMWRILNEAEIAFLPQYIVDWRYIADFYLPEFSLIIEVDGPGHALQQDKDQKRERYLGKRGFYGVRFTNREVLDDPDGVKSGLWAVIEQIRSVAS